MRAGMEEHANIVLIQREDGANFAPEALPCLMSFSEIVGQNAYGIAEA